MIHIRFVQIDIVIYFRTNTISLENLFATYLEYQHPMVLCGTALGNINGSILIKYLNCYMITIIIIFKKVYISSNNVIVYINSYESGILEDPAAHPPAGIFQMTVDPEEAPDTPEIITLSFEKGIYVLCLYFYLKYSCMNK